MPDNNEIKALSEKLGTSEDYVKSMLEFKDRYEEQKVEVTPMAEALGITPEEYISQMEQQQIHMAFLTSKGFDVKSAKGLQEAKAWIESTDPDDLMLGEPTGNAFDIAVGEMRRGMLLKAVDAELHKC